MTDNKKTKEKSQESKVKKVIKTIVYYFAAILRPFSRFFVRAIEKVENMDIRMICPGHGPILRTYWKEKMARSKEMCQEFLAYPDKNLVFVGYVSAYGYTRTLAEKIAEGIRSEGMDVDVVDVEKLGVEEIASHVEKANALLFGSPTINQNALPPVYNCFAALTPLRDRGKLAGAFGSYGWSGEAKDVLEANIHAHFKDRRKVISISYPRNLFGICWYMS